jgi:hypothetical protein
MSISIGGKIVTDGLLMHFDAANKRSYPGSGTNWFNLAPYPNRSGSFVGASPVVANGYASFTGLDDPLSPRIIIGTNTSNDIDEINQLTEYVTVDMWLKLKTPLTADNDAKYICGWGTAYAVQVRDQDNMLGFTGQGQTNEIYGISNVSELGLFNNWKHYCFVMLDSRNGPTISDHKIYINGESQALSAQVGTVSSTYFRLSSFTSTFFGFPSRNFTNGQDYTLNSDIAIVKVYTRELSQTEVTQNFNAHKGRFNIY